MEYKIKSSRVFRGGRFMPEEILVSGKKISGKGAGDAQEIDLGDYYVLPGLIDTHIHGCNGADTMDGTYEALETMSAYLASHGVTSFVPTTVTAPMDKLTAAIKNVKAAKDKGTSGAQIQGAYIEGPYINPKHRGAHPTEFIRDISLDEISALLDAGEGIIRTMIIAPEKPGALEAVELLTSRGVNVSIGHSGAKAAEAYAAADRGASIGVHMFNAMVGLHHREPGIGGAVLTDDRITAELICDGIHVDPAAMKIAWRCKCGKIVLITDCMCAGGLADGSYMLGELQTVVKDGVARLEENGALAGSTLSLDKAVKNAVIKVGVSFPEAIRSATEIPARLLGIYQETGSLEPGKQADIIAMDDQYQVVFVMIGGKIVMDKRGK